VHEIEDEGEERDRYHQEECRQCEHDRRSFAEPHKDEE
jgi:hypothetical protein